MTGKFSNEGVVSTSGTVLHTAPDNNISEVYFIRFYNPSAYTITISKYTSSTASTIDVYSLELDGGDVPTDEFRYLLDEGDRIEALCNISGTTYTIEGQDMPNINTVRCR
jgi:hypothetical protein